MAGALAAPTGSHAIALMVVIMVVLCWKESVTQEHLAFQSSCEPENISKATNTCNEQGMHIFNIIDYKLPGTFATEAKADHGSIWISGHPDGCAISENNTFSTVNCSEEHYYLCKRNATMEEELSRNDSRTWAIYVPCQRKDTSLSPPSSTTPGTARTTATTRTTDADPKGLSNTAIYLIVAVAVCVVVVCVVAAVVIKRCTKKKQENVTLKNVDVVREKDEGAALAENGDNNVDTPM